MAGGTETTRRQVATADGPAPDEPTTTVGHGLARGERIGRYHVLERIGMGGMGTVYLAFDGALERKVAIKVLRTADAGSLADRERLLAEAKAMAQLAHPNVVAVHEAGIDRGRVYLAMEYVQGQTLRQWLAGRDRSWRDVAEVFRQAALGLAAAHAAAIIHRDVKPDNILVGADDRVRITDFGIAIDLVSATTGRGSGTDLDEEQRAHSGTPAYMPLEQLRGDAVDERSDQFSLAVGLFEALWGRRPFDGRTTAELRRAQEDHVADPPFDRTVPAWLRDIVVRALARAPAERWPSMEAFAEALHSGLRPAARRVWTAAITSAAVVGLASAAIAVRLAGEPADTCDRDELEAEWNDERRTAIAAALSVGAGALAVESSRLVLGALDEYAAAWSSASRDACVRHAASEQSDTLFDRRQACLRSRKRAFVSLGSLLERSDPEVARNAAAAVAALPRLRDCDAARLVDEAAWAVPADPELRARHEAVLDLLAAWRARYDAGDLRGGFEQTPEVMAVVRELDDDTVTIAALETRAAYQRRLDQYLPSSVSLLEAWHVALRSGSAIASARIAILQAEVLGYSLWDEGAALTKIADAVPLVERVETIDPEVAAELRARLLGAQGQVALRAGRLDRALEYSRAALSAYESLPDPAPLEHADFLGRLATVESAMGNPAAAAERSLAALTVREGILGREHPDIGSLLNNVGLFLRNSGRPADAVPYFERAVAIARASLGEQHSSTVMAERNLAISFHILGRHAEAVPLYERTLRPPSDGQFNSATTAWASQHAASLVAIGRSADALRVLEEAVAGAERALRERHRFDDRTLRESDGEAWALAKLWAGAVASAASLARDLGDVDGAARLDARLRAADGVLGRRPPDEPPSQTRPVDSIRP